MQQCSETFSDVDTPKIDSLSKKCNNLHFWSKAPTYSDKQKVIYFDMQVCSDLWLFVKYGWYFFLHESYVLFWSVLKSFKDYLIVFKRGLYAPSVHLPTVHTSDF